MERRIIGIIKAKEYISANRACSLTTTTRRSSRSPEKFLIVSPRRPKEGPIFARLILRVKKIKFLDNVWPHLNQKHPRDKFRRLQLLRAGLKLIRNTKCKPIFAKRDRLDHRNFYRFLGKAAGQVFIVQTKEDLKRRQKFFMSAFGYSEK